MFFTPEGPPGPPVDPDFERVNPIPMDTFVLNIDGREEVIAVGLDVDQGGQNEDDNLGQPQPDDVVNDEDDEDDEQVQEFADHFSTCNRFQKTLYYGGNRVEEMPMTERFSLPTTEICVEKFSHLTTTLTDTGLLFNNTEEHLNRLNVDKASKLSKSTSASPTSLVLALLYLDRLRNKNPSYLRTVSSTDLFLVSLMVASKFLHDDGENEEVFVEDWADAAGLEPQDLCQKELDFLDAIEWSLYISPDEFCNMRSKLEYDIARKEVKKRGWASYTDLMVLYENGFNVKQVIEILYECLVKVTTVCATAYAASLLTMFGTLFVLNKANMGPSSVSSNLANLFPPDSAKPTDNILGQDYQNSSNPELEDSATPILSSQSEDILSNTVFLLNAIEENKIDKVDLQSLAKEKETGVILTDSESTNWFGNLEIPLHHSTSVLLRPNGKLSISLLEHSIHIWKSLLQDVRSPYDRYKDLFSTDHQCVKHHHLRHLIQRQNQYQDTTMVFLSGFS